MTEKKKYDESSIERYAGLLGIRKRPTPYIGPNDSDGLLTILREPADNAVDRALAGDNDYVHVVYGDKPNQYWILDKGPGFPVGVKTFMTEKGDKEKLSTFYVTTGLTHAGANFSGDTISRGVHGIGIKATNAMSKSFIVWTFRDKQWWCIEYKDARLHKEPYKVKSPPKLPHGIKHTKGSIIYVEPDLSLFQKESKINLPDLQSWCSLTSYLVPGIVVEFTNAKGKTFTLKHERGLLDYLDRRIQEMDVKADEPVFQHNSKLSSIIVAFTDADGCNISSYTNGLFNKDGGEHFKALLDSMFKSLQKYMKPVKSKGKKKAKQEWPFTKTDVADGLLGLVNCKLAAPKFSNQPKDRLVDERVHGPMVEELVPAWEKFWKANKDFALKIIERATLLNDRTTDFRKDKTLIKNVKSSARRVATKLAAITSSKTPVEKRELLIVEGDSAGGGLKRARDKTFQAVYPLRGKPMNVLTAKKEKINDNAEITGLLSALGVNGKDAKPTLYGKVILFADSDVDGAHINVLMSGAFYKFLPHLIQNGNLYVVKAPRYKARHRDKVIFAQTKEEVYKKAGTENVDISHLKGWGEVNEEDLWHVALDPATRKLYKLVAADKKDSKEFELLIGENTSYRKKLFGVS